MISYIERKFNYLFCNILTLTMFLYSLNLRVVFDINRFNPIEKSSWLLLSILSLISGRASKEAFYFSAFFIILCHILLLGVSHTDFSYFAFILSLTQIPILFILCSTTFTTLEIRNIFVCFCWMPIFILFFGFIYNLLGITEFYGIEYSTGLARLKGSTSSAYLASWCIASIYCSMKLSQITKEAKYYIFTLVYFVIIYLTVARMPLVLSLIIFIYLLVFSSPHIKSEIKVNSLFFGLSCAPFVVFYFSDKYMMRIESSGDSGRDIIWSYLLYRYKTDFKYWGAGFGHEYRIIPEIISNLTSTVAAHNEYIRILVELGIIGSVIFWPVFVAFFIRIWLKSNSFYKNEMVLIFMLFLIFSYFDNTITSPAVFSFLFCCFAFNNSTWPNEYFIGK